MNNNDTDMIQRILDGDQQAFTELVEKYQKQVHALVWQKIGDFHIAQEITQDVFLSAFQKLSTLKQHNRLAGWLYVIADNKCKNWFRKKRLTYQSLEETDPVELEEVYYSEYMTHQREAAAKRKRRGIVQKLLSTLQESDRTVVNLYYIAEMSCEDIGKFMGMSPNTVRSKLHRARNRLKKEESIIQENLSSFQLPTQMTENIMEKVSRLMQSSPSVNKPYIPLVISVASAIFVVLLMGVGTKSLMPYQQPYSLTAKSEPTIEIVDAQLILESPVKPVVDNQIKRSDVLKNDDGTGQVPDTSQLAASQEKNGISDKNGQWSKTNGPVGGKVINLYATVDGNVFAGTYSGIYELTDDKAAWTYIYPRGIFAYREQLSGMRSGPMVEKDGILYLATNEKIISSKNKGKTWKTLSVHPRGGLMDVAIVDQTFYLCLKDEYSNSGDNGVYRSDVNGTSWVRITPFDNKYPNIEPRAIAVIENTIFVGTNKGLYRLNGNTWEQIFLDEIGEKSTYLPIISMEVADNVLYVVRSYHVDNNFRVFLDRKPKKPVHQITNDSYAIQRWTPSSLDREIALAQAATRLTWELFVSSDHGATWEKITPRKDNTDKEELTTVNLLNGASKGRKDNKKKDTESSHKSSGNRPLKIMVTDNQLMLVDQKKHYHSSNSGETWNTVDTDALGNAFAIAIVNEDTYYRSGNYGIHRSTDGGKSWHQFNTGLVNTDVWQLIAIDGTLYANSVNGFVYSTDGGESWTPVNGDTGFITRIIESNGEIIVRDDKFRTPRFFRLSSQDYSLTSIPEVPILNKVDPWKENPLLDRPTGYNRGRNVSHGDGSFSESQLGGIAVVNGTYYAEYNYQLYRWKPSNKQWFNTRLLDKGVSDDYSFCYANNWFIDAIGFRFAVSGKTVYVGEKEGQLMQSLDEGLTWTDVTEHLPFYVDHFKAIALADNIVYVATDWGVVKSSNGIDWHRLTDAKGNPLIITMFAVDGTTVYGESSRKIYQVNSGMTIWERITPKIPPSIAHIITCFDVDGNTLYVGTRSKGVLRFSLDDSTDR